jgi:hypothetical protein
MNQWPRSLMNRAWQGVVMSDHRVMVATLLTPPLR